MKLFFLQLTFIFLGVSSLYSQTEINKLDDKGLKHGSWKGVYADTQNLKFEGTFEHGQETGLFTFYENAKTKIVLATRQFEPQKNTVYSTIFDQKHNKVSEGMLLNKQNEGKWVYYHKASAQVMTTENYKQGKLEGVRTVFYANGKIAEEVHYKNNKKNGSYKKYAENGIEIESSNYINDQFDGIAIFKDADTGAIISKGKFVNGKKMGIWQFFDKGKLVKEENMSFQKRIKPQLATPPKKH